MKLIKDVRDHGKKSLPRNRCLRPVGLPVLIDIGLEERIGARSNELQNFYLINPYRLHLHSIHKFMSILSSNKNVYYMLGQVF